MKQPENIINSYDKVAEDYAHHRIDELSKKPFDRMLLKEFAALNKNKAACADFGCGPGHTTKFLYDHGMKDITGIDLSPGMIAVARKIFPELQFETGDLLGISFGPGSFGSVIAFYAIVHFDYEQIRAAFNEINRVLKTGGQFLFSFHAGDKTVHFDRANEIKVDIDLHFHRTNKIIALLEETGFKLLDAVERWPYDPQIEYQSRRAYVWAEKRLSGNLG